MYRLQLKKYWQDIGKFRDRIIAIHLRKKSATQSAVQEFGSAEGVATGRNSWRLFVFPQPVVRSKPDRNLSTISSQFFQEFSVELGRNSAMNLQAALSRALLIQRQLNSECAKVA